MELKSTIKKASIVAALGFGLSVSAAAVPGNTAFAASTSNVEAQKLVDSLQVLNIGDVSYLYAYLQSITLSTAEYNGIIANVNQVNTLLNGKSAGSLSSADKTTVANLFLDSVKLAHLQATIVNDKGEAVSITDLANYKAGTTGIKIQLKDLNGKILAVADPTVNDLSAVALQTKINALEAAVNAKKELDATGTFVPMPSAALPNTAGNDVGYMALGGLLILLGGIAVVPAVRMVRKSEVPAEA